MDELIKELHTLWNLSDDPRYKGEHPRCAEILDELYEKFSQIDEETLKDLLDTLDEQHLEEITGALMDLPYDWVRKYERL